MYNLKERKKNNGKSKLFNDYKKKLNKSIEKASFIIRYFNPFG